MTDTKAGVLTTGMIDQAAEKAAASSTFEDLVGASAAIVASRAFNALVSSIVTSFPRIDKAAAESLVLTVFAIAIPIGQHLAVPVAVKVVKLTDAEFQRRCLGSDRCEGCGKVQPLIQVLDKSIDVKLLEIMPEGRATLLCRQCADKLDRSGSMSLVDWKAVVGGYWCQNCSRVEVEKQGSFCEACKQLLIKDAAPN
jgi:hypothetical protein